MTVNQIDSNTEKLSRELRMTRIFCMVTSLFTVILLLGGGILYMKLQGMMEKAQPLVEQVARLDVETLNDTLQQISDTIGSVDWTQVSDTLGQLDVEALNTAIENLDTKEFSTSLANLNDAVAAIQEVKEAINSFLAKFKR